MNEKLGLQTGMKEDDGPKRVRKRALPRGISCRNCENCRPEDHEEHETQGGYYCILDGMDILLDDVCDDWLVGFAPQDNGGN